MTRMRLTSCWVGVVLLGCAPSLDWSVDSTCEGASVAVAIESGDCGSASGVPGVAFTDVQDPMARAMASFGEQDTGRQCFETFAYHMGRRDDLNGHQCRVAAADIRTLLLPDDRGQHQSALECATEPPGQGAGPPLHDALLRNVVGCCPECDVARCVCSGGCDFMAPADPPTEESDLRADHCAAACQPPVRVRSLVATDTFVCGAALDGRGIWCWGRGGPPTIAAALEGSGGAAVHVPIESLSAGSMLTSEVLLKLDAEGERLCFGSDLGPECVDEGVVATGVSGIGTPSHIAVTGDRLCFGETQVYCVNAFAPGSPIEIGLRTRGTSRIVGSQGSVCAIVGGEVLCGGSDCDSPSMGRARLCPMRQLTLPEPPEAREQNPVPQVAIRLAAGWGRACVVLGSRDLACWDLTDPTAQPARVTWDRPGPLNALDVSVGESHLCFRSADSKRVECGALVREGAGYRLENPQLVESRPVREILAGPDGLSCVVRQEDDQVVCQYPPGLSVGEDPTLLGLRNTRDLPTDPFRPVCP